MSCSNVERKKRALDLTLQNSIRVFSVDSPKLSPLSHCPLSRDALFKITITVMNRPFELYIGAICRADRFTRSHIELVLRRSRGQPLHHTCSFIWYNVRACVCVCARARVHACVRACVCVQVNLPGKKSGYENTYSIASTLRPVYYFNLTMWTWFVVEYLRLNPTSFRRVSSLAFSLVIS